MVFLDVVGIFLTLNICREIRGSPLFVKAPEKLPTSSLSAVLVTEEHA